VPPDWIAWSTVALSVAFPLAPLSQGPQSGTETGPGWPRAPVWMCAAFARPVKPLNVSRQLRLPPDDVFVTVPVNVPRAPLTLPVGAGTS
jgi:hypothetical protein